MSEQVKTDIGKLIALSESDRLDAREVALNNIRRRIGPEPQRDQFENKTASKYPAGVSYVITILSLLLLAFFWLPSAFRIYRAAHDAFLVGVPNGSQASIAGVSFVLGAEIATVVFAMVAGVLDMKPGTRRAVWLAAVGSALVAILGNVTVSIPHDTATNFDWLTTWFMTLVQSPFAALEAIAPPLFTLVGALVLKEQALDSIARRHADQRAYDLALAAWKEQTAEPEKHEQWKNAYMNALKQQIIKVNGSGRGQQERRDIMQSMSGADWRSVCMREWLADDWTADTAESAVMQLPSPLPSMISIAPAAHPQERETAPLAVSANGHNHNGNGTGAR